MPASREQFVAYQAAVLDEFFGLAPGEDDARWRFEQMAVETYDCIAQTKPVSGAFFPYPSAFNFASDDRSAGAAVPAELRKRWSDWKEEYLRLRDRHPLIELREMLHTISESNDRSSWPDLWLEAEIQDWVDGGDRLAIPFLDRDGIATVEFYGQLRLLRHRIRGWLYQDLTQNRIRFVPEHQLPEAKAERAKRRNQQEDQAERRRGPVWRFKREEWRLNYLAECRRVLLANDVKPEEC